MISKITTKVTITGLVLGFVLDVPSQGSSFCICISTLPATWLFGWPHKRSAYRLHIFKLLYIHILTLHFSWLNFDFSFITWLHPLITNFRRGNLRGNKQSKLTRTSPPQNCTETNLDMEWQGVNNDGNFEQGPIAEKGTVFVVLNFCKSDHRPACEWFFIFCNSQCEARLTCFHAFLQCICFSTD